MSENKITIDKLKSLLYIEVKRLLELKNSLDFMNVKLDILKSLIETIKDENLEFLIDNKLIISMQLDSIFDDNIYINDFLNTMVRIENSTKNGSLNDIKKEIHMFYNRLYKKYEEMNFEKELMENDYSVDKLREYRTIVSCLKYRQPLAKNLYHSMYNFLEQKHYDKLLIVKLCEYIRLYNAKAYLKYDKAFNKYDLFNMMNAGYEKYEKISINPKKDLEIDKITNNLLSIAKDYLFDFETYKMSLPMYDKNIYDKNEYKKISYDLLAKMQQEIFDTVALIKDEEFYFDNETKIEVLNEYKANLNLYLNCRKFFDNQLKELENKCEIIEENDTENSINNLNKINFLFASSSDISYIERDLRDVPEEYYKKIEYLLRKKRGNNTTQLLDKQLINNNKLKQFRELRLDQVRILYKNLNNNSILILGVGVKKTDNDRNLYYKLAKRNNLVDKKILDSIDDEETYNKILDLCEKNHRKGNR